MNVLLAIADLDYSKPIESFGDKLGFGGMMLGIGMLAVFAVLCILWGALMIFKVFFYDMPNKEKSAPAPAAVAPAPVAEVSESADDEELVAVIAAAIAAAESESVGTKFRVVSFKRK